MGLIPLPTHTLYPPYMPPASLSPPHKPYVIPEVNKRVPEEKKQSDRGGENRTTILKISLAPTTTAGAGPTLHVRRTPSRTASLVLPGGLPQDLNGNRRLMNHLVARLQSKTSPEGAASSSSAAAASAAAASSCSPVGNLLNLQEICMNQIS